MTDTWDDDDRAIARALGADGPEADDADADAVADYETVLTHLPFESVPPADDLEDRVVAAALAQRPAAARALDGKQAERRNRVSPRWVGGAVAAVAAAAIVVAIMVGGPSTTPGSGASIEPVTARNSLARVLERPGARAGTLRTAGGAAAGQVVLAPDGQGYVYRLAPPTDAAGREWLWLDTGADPIRVGRMTREPDAPVHFVVRGDVDAVRGVFTTAEPTRAEPSVPGPLRLRAQLTGD